MTDRGSVARFLEIRDAQAAGGAYQGDNVTCAAVECESSSCPEDFDGDGIVGFTDLLAVLAAWGPCS